MSGSRHLGIESIVCPSLRSRAECFGLMGALHSAVLRTAFMVRDFCLGLGALES
jgi:hypothetical protein